MRISEYTKVFDRKALRFDGRLEALRSSPGHISTKHDQLSFPLT